MHGKNISGIRNAKIYLLNKFRENVQEFQQNVRNHEISTVVCCQILYIYFKDQQKI